MIVRSHGANVTLRSLDTPDLEILRGTIPAAGGAATSTGLNPTWKDAYGLPAVLFCILLAARSGSQLPCDVYRPAGEGAEKAYDAPQRTLLHTRPLPGAKLTPRTMWWSTIAAMLGRGNALIRKFENRRGEVIGLEPLAPSAFDIRREKGEIRYYLGRERLDPDTLIHVVGDVLDDPEIGVSPLAIARETIAAGLAQQRFEGRFYASDGTPSEIVTLPKEVGTVPEKRDDFRRAWEGRHKPGGRRQLGLLWGDMKYEKISVSLADAQYAESAALSTTRAAQVLGMPVGIVDPEADQDPASTDRRYRELFMQPLLTAIEQALHVDDQLFPDKILYPKINTNALLRPSLKERADAYRLLRQGGIETANELRRLEELPDRTDGDELQATPVGGAPNPDGASRSDFQS